MRMPSLGPAASRALTCLAGVILALSLAGCLEATPCAEPGCPAPTEDESGWDQQRQLTLEIGRMLEAGIDMRAGDLVEIAFESADGPSVAWNVHSHDGTERPRHAEGRDTADTIQFVAPHDGEFWSLWTNDQADSITVDVRFRLGDGSFFRGWRDEL